MIILISQDIVMPNDGNSDWATWLNIPGSSASNGKGITSSANDADRQWNSHMIIAK
jgi:hypothetical protein